MGLQKLEHSETRSPRFLLEEDSPSQETTRRPLVLLNALDLSAEIMGLVRRELLESERNGLNPFESPETFRHCVLGVLKKKSRSYRKLRKVLGKSGLLLSATKTKEGQTETTPQAFRSTPQAFLLPFKTTAGWNVAYISTGGRKSKIFFPLYSTVPEMKKMYALEDKLGSTVGGAGDPLRGGLHSPRDPLLRTPRASAGLPVPTQEAPLSPPRHDPHPFHHDPDPHDAASAAPSSSSSGSRFTNGSEFEELKKDFEDMLAGDWMNAEISDPVAQSTAVLKCGKPAGIPAKPEDHATGDFSAVQEMDVLEQVIRGTFWNPRTPLRLFSRDPSDSELLAFRTQILRTIGGEPVERGEAVEREKIVDKRYRYLYSINALGPVPAALHGTTSSLTTREDAGVLCAEVLYSFLVQNVTERFVEDEILGNVWRKGFLEKYFERFAREWRAIGAVGRKMEQSRCLKIPYKVVQKAIFEKLVSRVHDPRQRYPSRLNYIFFLDQFLNREKHLDQFLDQFSYYRALKENSHYMYFGRVSSTPLLRVLAQTSEGECLTNGLVGNGLETRKRRDLLLYRHRVAQITTLLPGSLPQFRWEELFQAASCQTTGLLLDLRPMSSKHEGVSFSDSLRVEHKFQKYTLCCNWNRASLLKRGATRSTGGGSSGGGSPPSEGQGVAVSWQQFFSVFFNFSDIFFRLDQK